MEDNSILMSVWAVLLVMLFIGLIVMPCLCIPGLFQYFCLKEGHNEMEEKEKWINESKGSDKWLDEI